MVKYCYVVTRYICCTIGEISLAEWVIPVDENGSQIDQPEPNQDLTVAVNGLCFDHDVFESPDYNQEQAWFDFVYLR